MSRMRAVEDRYNRDAMFHHLVRAIEDILEKVEMTPTEVREAAVYACTRFAARHPHTFFVQPEFSHAMRESIERALVASKTDKEFQEAVAKITKKDV